MGLRLTLTLFRVFFCVPAQAFAVHVLSFSVENMADFLGGLTTGSTRTKPLEALPEIVSVEVS